MTTYDSSTNGQELVQVRDLKMYFPVTKGIILQRTVGAVNPAAPDTGDLANAAGLSAFVQDHWLLVSGQGPAADPEDLRPDAAAVLAYAVARYAARAPELVR